MRYCSSVLKPARLTASSDIEIRTNEGVAALDVMGQVGQGTLTEHAELFADRLFAFTLQHLEQQGELGDLDGLGVDIHPVDMVEQDALALGGGQLP